MGTPSGYSTGRRRQTGRTREQTEAAACSWPAVAGPGISRFLMMFYSSFVTNRPATEIIATAEGLIFTPFTYCDRVLQKKLFGLSVRSLTRGDMGSQVFGDKPVELVRDHSTVAAVKHGFTCFGAYRVIQLAPSTVLNSCVYACCKSGGDESARGWCSCLYYFFCFHCFLCTYSLANLGQMICMIYCQFMV